MRPTTPNQLKSQRGHIEIPKGVVDVINILAFVGAATILCGFALLGYWVITPVRFI